MGKAASHPARAKPEPLESWATGDPARLPVPEGVERRKGR
jgi:hypothetical protein